MSADENQEWWEALHQQYACAANRLWGKYQSIATARKCAWCVSYPRPGWRERIQDCAAYDCPLWKSRSYREDSEPSCFSRHDVMVDGD